MSLKDDKQQNIQMKLDFSSALTGAARGAAGGETESLVATSGPENPARSDRLMEEVCERENLKEALRQVKGNKGSAGVDGITVNQLTDYLKQHWPVIREQLLNGTYEPKPVRRVEIPKPDGGVRLHRFSRTAGTHRQYKSSTRQNAGLAVEHTQFIAQVWRTHTAGAEESLVRVYRVSTPFRASVGEVGSRPLRQQAKRKTVKSAIIPLDLDWPAELVRDAH
jgi:hypothetical protein